MNASLPAIIDRAALTLTRARTSAEILEAKAMATIAYDVAKVTARIARAKGAHDEVVAAAHRAQADALELEAGAKRRLADEYDAAQERGEVASRGGERSGRERSPIAPSAAEIGLTRKEIHEARKIRDAEERDPGVVRRTLDQQLKAGLEPSKAALRRAVSDDDEEDEVDDPPRKKDAFLVFANEAMLLAKYDGPIDREVIQAAKDTASAWKRLANSMEQGK